jgi:hypothetical protein
MNSYSEDYSQCVGSNITRLLLLFSVYIALLLAAIPARAATFTVTNTADGGAGSLRAAIAAATNGDTITFSLSSPSTILLTSGRLLISQSLTISGPGPGSLAISGSGTNGVFEITNGPVPRVSTPIG